jgi:hypothetical protein
MAESRAECEVLPWERQPSEGEEEWQAFRNYRDQAPPRRIQHVYVRRTADVSKWSADHCWSERVAAYDRHLDEERRTVREAVLKESEKERAARQLGQLKSVQDIIDLELAKLWRDAKNSEAFGLVKVNDLNKLMANAITLERLIRGQSTENVASTDVDLENLSPDELRQLRELQQKMKGAI